MSKMDELLEKQAELVEQLQVDNNTSRKTERQLEDVSKQIADLKEQHDYGSFKFIHANMPMIIQKIAPKHKIPPPHEVTLSSGAEEPTMKASVPWVNGDCSDTDPCNVNVCPRCTLMHFHKVMDRLLAEYYTK